MIIEQTIVLPAVAVNSVFEDVRSYLNNLGVATGEDAEVPLGVYENLLWNPTDPLSESSVTTWGTKTLPGAGAFYFANHEDGNPTMGHLDPAQSDD